MVVLAGIYLLLLIPEKSNRVIVKAADKPFAWKQDSIWSALESEFREAQSNNPSSIDSNIQLLFD